MNVYDKLFSGVNDNRFSVDTGELYRRWQRHRWTIIACDHDTGDKFIAGDKWRWGTAKDRRKLKGIHLRYLRPPKSTMAADGVIGTAMKCCIHKHPTHLDQRPLRPPKLNNAVLVWSSFGSLWGLWSGYVRCLSAFSWLFQWQFRRPWPTSAAGDSFAAKADLCHQYSLSPVENFIAGVVDTGEQFIADVNDTGDNIFPRCRWYRSEKPKSLKFIAGVIDTAEKLFTGVNDTADKFFGGVSDTGD
jgi:hypothetical protein